MNNAEPTDLEELLDYLARTTRLERAEAERLVDEVLSFLGEEPEQFVRRRHLELQRQGPVERDDLRTPRTGAVAPTFCCAGLLQAATAPHRLRLGTAHVRNRRLYRQASGCPHPARGPASARISRLRLGRHRGRQQGQAASRQAQGPGPRARRPAAAEVQGHVRHRPHALGDPWRAERPQRPSPQRRHRPLRRGAQRHRRERRGAARATHRARLCLHLRHRHRGVRPSHRPDGRRLAARDRRGRGASAHRRRLWAGGRSTPSGPIRWSWRATAARSCSASATARCSSPPILPRSCGTPRASSISTTARSPRSTPTATRRARSRARPRSRLPRRSRGRTKPSTRASSPTTCARRSRSSRRRCGARSADGSIRASRRPISAASRSPPATCSTCGA